MTCPVPSQSTGLSVENPDDPGCGNRSNPKVSISACILYHLPRYIIFLSYHSYILDETPLNLMLCTGHKSYINISYIIFVER